MRKGLLIFALIGAAILIQWGRARLHTSGAERSVLAATPLASVSKPDFETEIKPIFKAECQPCHFQGGKMYEKMPFDRPETITRLGTKLFTRIKDEKEQQLIRAFLGTP